MDQTVFDDLAKSLSEMTGPLKEAMDEVVKVLAPLRKVAIKGADIKPDVYGGYLQKKRRRKKGRD